VYEPPAHLFWLLFGIGLTIAITLTYHDLRKQKEIVIDGETSRKIQDTLSTQIKEELEPLKASIKLQVQEGNIESVSAQDKRFITSLTLGMTLRHGHLDLKGLLADRASGIALNKLMSRECSKCGLPRNRKEIQQR
jgi:hypothetical protein